MLLLWSLIVVEGVVVRNKVSSFSLANRGVLPAGDESSRQRAVLGDVSRVGELMVPNLAIGTIAWTPPRGSLVLPGDNLDPKAGTLEKQRGLAQLALGKGCALFDTAERYSVGAGERLLADAVEDGPRGAVVATKFTPTPWRYGAGSVVEACRASIERLRVDAIDLYQLHMPAWGGPTDEMYWEGLAQCVELGLCRAAGVSNYGPTKLRACHDFLAARGVKLATNQIHYSLIARKAGNQNAVDVAAELGVKTLAYYPLAMGLLSSSARTREGPLRHYARGGLGYIGVPWLEKNRVDIPDGGILPLVRALETVAAKYDKTPSQVALNWVISQGVIPVVGATTEQYLLDAIGALGWRLPAIDRVFLESVADDLGFEFRGTWFKRVDSKFVGYGVEYWSLD